MEDEHMDSMNNCRERVERRRHWGLGVALGMMLMLSMAGTALGQSLCDETSIMLGHAGKAAWICVPNNAIVFWHPLDVSASQDFWQKCIQYCANLGRPGECVIDEGATQHGFPIRPTHSCVTQPGVIGGSYVNISIFPST